MCYKCLYFLAFAIVAMLIIYFFPPDEWANWITALSTLAMAIIAGKALNSWKEEIKLKKIYRINRNYIKTIDEFLKLLHNYELISNKQETRYILEKLLEEINIILYEYKLIEKNAETEFLNNLMYFKTILEKYTEETFKTDNNWLGFCFSYENFGDDYAPIQENDGDISYTQEYKELLNKLNNAKKLCEQNIYKFYK